MQTVAVVERAGAVYRRVIMQPIPPAAITELNAHIVESVRTALLEDIGSGDVTAMLVGAQTLARANITVRETAVLCGTAWVDEVFHQLRSGIEIDWLASDGEQIMNGQTVCELSGNARAILSGERTALNFLQILSATATTTAAYVAEVAGTECRILDTRKTIPGLRLGQKYAVRCGGGTNHRLGLYDAILIKENHIASAGGIATAIDKARSANPGLPIEIEVESPADLAIALDARAERVLLDNFSIEQLTEAVQQNRSGDHPRSELEASGGFTLRQIRRIAETGVDYISVGALTKHVQATDYSMRFAFSSRRDSSP